MTQMLAPLHNFSVQLPAAMAATGGAHAGGASSGSLANFTMQTQRQSQWCWAAVSASVSDFYGVASWTQCEIAEGEFHPLLCCGSDASGPCNKAHHLNGPLTRVGHFVSYQGGNSPFATVAAEINAGQPFCCRIAWSGGYAHFIALGAYSTDATGKQWVDVHDPFYGYVQIGYADFISGYKAPGDQWTHSYFTSRHAAIAGGGGPIDPNAPISA